MVIAQNSLICRFFMCIWSALCLWWPSSLLGRCIEALPGIFSRWTRGSGLCRFLSREGALPRAWGGSLFCRALTALVNFPGWLWSKLSSAGGVQGSLFCRGLTAIGGVGFVWLGLFLAVMLSVPHIGWDNLYGLMGAIVLFGLFALGIPKKPSQRLAPAAVGPYYFLFFLTVCLGLVSSFSLSMSLRFFAFHLTAFFLVLLTVSAVDTRRKLDWLITLVLIGLTVASAFGVYQGIVGVPVVASQQDMILNAGMPGRVYSFFDNPNNFAEVLLMFTPLTFAAFLNAKTWRGKVGAVVCFALSLASLGYTLSRSCWLGFALAVFLFLAIMNWRLVPLFLLGAVACIPLLPETIYHRLLTIGSTKDSSFSYRFSIWQATSWLMEDHWFTGIGLGSDILRDAFTQYPRMFDGNFPVHTHNNYLQMWAELGVPGIAAFLSALAYQVKSGFTGLWRCPDKGLKAILAAALSSFCGILLVSVAEYTWFYPRNMFCYFFLFGLIAATARLIRRQKEADGV